MRTRGVAFADRSRDTRPVIPDDAIEAMFRAHGVAGAWEVLPATGVANTIYGTKDVVLRVATDHPDGVSDARTESVAAPVALAAGIRTPRLLAFDDTRRIVDRPYSLWERVKGGTLGLVAPDGRSALSAWAEVGRELARLHACVDACPDPNNWLEVTEDDDAFDKRSFDAALGALPPADAHRIDEWLAHLQPMVGQAARRFVHNDVHAMNVMCDAGREYLALIDWGDAGWGDPALDFSDLPTEVVVTAFEAYETEAGGAAVLDDGMMARVLWHRWARALNRAARGIEQERVIAGLFHLADHVTGRWRQFVV
jgi:aminoglycoside phosphotransferase (APT) family kinase protein